MAECVLCGYEIKDCMATITRMLTRRDTAAFEFNVKNVCGSCHDELSEYLEGESSPDFPYAYEPKTMAKTKLMKMDKKTSFLEDYKAFKESAQELRITNEEILHLFAIYRKDGRTESIRSWNGGSGKPAQDAEKAETITEKQKSYIKSICEAKQMPFNEMLFNNMTKIEASKWIDSELNNGGG
jgi:hypothetical protein